MLSPAGVDRETIKKKNDFFVFFCYCGFHMK